MPDTDTRLAAVWHVEECSDEYRENCACIIATGTGDRIQYVADAETPQLAAQIVADHNEVIALREQLVKVTAFCAQRAEYVAELHRCTRDDADYYRWSGHAEARRQLSQQLGLPVGWPIAGKAVPA
ncbi:hypothetical protein [Streptomyces virginiae]|uniref:hypothetical protein n=1 Tax=Streptomyces virginiae TaxID=1961 RepID=UPI0022576D5B|nr:hypothetical protein [Streptomyces virginiae]MCX5176772.1 hypothetical protein [Streptomyces virginiae]